MPSNNAYKVSLEPAFAYRVFTSFGFNRLTISTNRGFLSILYFEGLGESGLSQVIVFVLIQRERDYFIIISAFSEWFSRNSTWNILFH